jgi:phosphoribosyl-ATP pyrophosphohydrolase/phosphoribosyl-AMP cyclohydrolase
MVIPSIDIMGGQTVQLVGGREKALDAGDPRPIARQFSLAGEIALIDLDSAIGTGSNEALLREVIQIAPCRVGGGIRSVEAAVKWLDAGASKVILGTAAREEVLRELPPDRVIAALDAHNGEIVVKGWREGTGERIVDRMDALRGLVGGFLVTFVEREGRMVGIDLDLVRKLIAAAGDARLTVAGGVASSHEIAEIDRLGADAQVGMGLYTGRFDLAGAIAAPLVSDRPDGLWPTLVCDERGVALGLAYSDLESLREAVRTRRGVYRSRTRGLWRKGETSGAAQELLRIDLDCDRDTLRFTVRQHGAGFCHNGTATCFGQHSGFASLDATLAARRASAPAGSYSARLFSDTGLLRSKVVEEANELAAEIGADARTNELVSEAADVIYFVAAALAREGKSLADVERCLDARALRITRRKGDAKPQANPEASQ